jgi:hypothetical protein
LLTNQSYYGGIKVRWHKTDICIFFILFSVFHKYLFFIFRTYFIFKLVLHTYFILVLHTHYFKFYINIFYFYLFFLYIHLSQSKRPLHLITAHSWNGGLDSYASYKHDTICKVEVWIVTPFVKLHFQILWHL